MSNISNKINSKYAAAALLQSSGRRSSSKFELANFLVLIFVLLAALVSLNVLGTLRTYAQQVPTEEEIRVGLQNRGENSRIFDRNSNLLYTFKDPDRDRVYVEYSQLPPTLIAAALGAEDKDFFIHGGIDYLGTISGLITTITSNGANTVGGSTLTQQLVKRTLLTEDRTAQRKIQEGIISLFVERDYSKEEILEYYMNVVNFGGRIQGAGTASQVYFNKPVEQLTLEEAAFLIGLVQSPGEYSPLYAQNKVRALELAHGRMDGILKQISINPRILAFLNSSDLAYLRQDLWVDVDSNVGSVDSKYTAGMITKTPLTRFRFNLPVDELKAPHWVFYIRDLLQQAPYNLRLQDLYSGGFEIHTSLDLRIQELAESELKKGVDRLGPIFRFENGALVTIDARSGEILAMVGSKGYNLPEDVNNKRFDPEVNVTTASQTLGSSLKPWVAYGAFDSGKWNPESIVNDSPQKFNGNYRPKNVDGKFRGEMTIRNAMLDSRNLPFLKLQYEMGDWRFGEFMKKIGYKKINNYGLSAVIGGVDETLLDHVGAYTGMANGGRVMQKRAILRIIKPGGGDYYTSQTNITYNLNPNAVGQVNNILGDRGHNANFNRLKFVGNQKLAGKTGTSDGNKDTYYIGYGPKIVTGIWCGNNDNDRMTSSALGSSTALPVWNSYMREFFQRFPEYGQGGSY